VVATSNVEIAIRFADRVVIVHEGRVVADGAWRDLIVNGPEWVRHFLSVRLIGLDEEYARELDLPGQFIDRYWHQGGSHP
jgi:phospholipid/cholesterol/gamma-HCH transport system ATP-binding protein